MTALQKMTEVILIIAPFSGDDPTLLRATMREEQLRDVLAHDSYSDQLMSSFKEHACSIHDLDPTKCKIGIEAQSVRRPNFAERRKVLGIPTYDISDGRFLLH